MTPEPPTAQGRQGLRGLTLLAPPFLAGALVQYADVRSPLGVSALVFTVGLLALTVIHLLYRLRRLPR